MQAIAGGNDILAARCKLLQGGKCVCRYQAHTSLLNIISQIAARLVEHRRLVIDGHDDEVRARLERGQGGSPSGAADLKKAKPLC